MFRLVKVLNGNNQCEVLKLKYNASSVIGQGCALVCTNGQLNPATISVAPDFISLSDNKDTSRKTLEVMLVTEDMVFKVDYTGASKPLVGMNVGLSTHKNKMDAVTYNASGRGTIVALDDDPKIVYVRFRK